MFLSKYISSNHFVRNWLLWGIPILFVLCGSTHFIYQWSGESTLVGLFVPVNESVWEHLKMSFFPVLLWWAIGYKLARKSRPVSASQWFVSCTVSLLVCPLVIMSFYYTYTGAFGIESLILDIFSLLLGLTIGQFLAYHVYKYARNTKFWLPFAVIALVLFASAFILFTFAPPHLPLFIAGHGI